MKRTVVLILFSPVFLAALSASASAEVFERDWKTPGDGLLTYDDVNRREWLDLSVSTLDQFTGTTLEERFQEAILELAPGGTFDGFTVGTQADVLGLAESAGIDTTTDNFAINQGPVSQLIDLLGPTRVVPVRTWSVGFLDDFRTLPPPGSPQRLAALFDIHIQQFVTSRAALRFVPNVDLLEPEIYGVMLYRQVPEAASFALLVNGFFWAALKRAKFSICMLG